MTIATRLHAKAPYMQSLLRMASGYLLLLHGTAKLLGIPFVPMFADLHLLSTGGVAAVIELVCGALLLVGLLTRTSALIAFGLSVATYFVDHVVPLGTVLFPLLNTGESAVLFAAIFLYIFFAGAGPWSLDAMHHPD